MPLTRVILCGGVPADRLPAADADPLRLNRYGPSANVRLGAGQVREALTRNVPPVLLDLLDLALYVAAADHATGRGGLTDTDPDGAWRRHLVFRLPVRVPDVWRDADTGRRLTDLLGFLSDDRYEFDFRERVGGGETHTPFFEFGVSPLTGAVDEVAMFSGGLDSFAGAVEAAVTGGRRVLLVNHRTNPKPVAAQERLVQALARRAVANPPELLAVWANKAGGLNREYTQRSRSFLFAALGATVAHLVGLDRLTFYENGVISLNLPLAGQLVGGRASRTTHPKVLAGFGALFGRLVGKPFAVENPFLWKTKTEVVRLIADAGLAAHIRDANSCAHTWARPAGKTHCGDCSQCLDRRLAVLAAGRADSDPADGYHIDLFTGDRPADESRLLMAGYLNTANRVRGMADPRDFYARYAGEIGRALPHLPGRADTNARLVYELYRRHAGQVCGAVEQGIIGHAGLIARQELPPFCMLRQVVAPPDVLPARPSDTAPPVAVSCGRPPAPRHTFRSTGACWEIGLAGAALNTLLPSRGAAYIHALLSSPGVPVPALELVYRARRHAARYMLPAGGELADGAALAAYRARAAGLPAEMDRARKAGDAAEVDRVREEMNQIAEEVSRLTGLGGRRREASNPADQARKSVLAAIRRARQKIALFAPDVDRHLDHYLSTGRCPVYAPPAGTSWDL